jgi:hypothetical protein
LVDVVNRKNRRVAGIDVSDALDRDVEIERDLPMVIILYQALDPAAPGAGSMRVNDHIAAGSLISWLPRAASGSEV